MLEDDAVAAPDVRPPEPAPLFGRDDTLLSIAEAVSARAQPHGLQAER